MKVHVKYFAAIRERLGAAESVEVPAGSTVGALRELLIERGAAHAEVLAHGRNLRCALDQTLCDASAVIGEAAEVAFFPPVTGG